MTKTTTITAKSQAKRYIVANGRYGTFAILDLETTPATYVVETPMEGAREDEENRLITINAICSLMNQDHEMREIRKQVDAALAKPRRRKKP